MWSGEWSSVGCSSDLATLMVGLPLLVVPMAPVSVSTRLPPLSTLRVRPRYLLLAPLRVSTPPLAMLVVPASRISPPDQVIVPEEAKVAAPPREPPLKVRLVTDEAFAASVSKKAPPEMVRLPAD